MIDESEITDEHVVTEMTCDSCGNEWLAVHPTCEWLQCDCGGWTQVPPIYEGYSYG